MPLPGKPFLAVTLHGLLVWKGKLSCDVIHRPLGLYIEHDKSIVLSLHSDVQKLVVPPLGPANALVESNGIQTKNGLQTQIIVKKRKGITIPCTQNDVINFCWGAVFEVDGVTFDLSQQWSFCYLRGKRKSHRLCFPSANDAFCSILETLESDVFCR